MAIKGINKQIIEIKCTNNEYFDKVLLFVKCNGNSANNDVLMNMGRNYVKSITDSISPKLLYSSNRKWKKGKIAALISCIVAVILVGIMIYTFI